MSKPKSVDRPAPSFWLPFAVIGVVGMLLGATITYLTLRPRLQPPRESVTATVINNEDPASQLPPPELTAGLLPAQADHALANFYYDHQNWAEAIRLYNSAIKQGIDTADIHTDLGNACRFIGRIDEALAEYTRAQQLDPNHEFSLYNLGGLYLDDLRQPDKAVEIWNQYLVRFPTGRNVDAVRQSIARARSGPAGLAVPAAASSAKTNATEDLILRQIKSGQSDKTATSTR
jgi:tetratricopeptide (TPR) repeat protein